jgi:signal peptidase II
MTTYRTAPRPPFRRSVVVGVTALIVLAVAQFTSWLVNTYIPLHETIVVNPVVHFTHIRNTGAAFGLFPGNSMVFALTSTLIICAMLLYTWVSPPAAKYQYMCIGCIIGAAAGNIADRLVYGSVIDFIDIQGIPGWAYIFNVADVAIHVGAWPLLIGEMLGAHRGTQPEPQQPEPQPPGEVTPHPPNG